MLAYTGNPLDRKTERRIDQPFLNGMLHAAESLFLPMYEGNPLLVGEDAAQDIGFLSAGAASWRSTDLTVFLGMYGNQAYFAFDVGDDAARIDFLTARGRVEDLRSIAALLPLESLAIATQAKALFEWHRRNRFCGNCGTQTIPGDGGNKRDCPNCHAEHFPRTDPAVIMLVTHEEKCLLARNVKWTRNPRFSALAGFVEAGEPLEEAVAREVREEVGIPVRQIRYFASQPWPFPGSLMLGFRAEGEDAPLRLDPNEIAEARWFTRNAAADLLAKRLPDANPPLSTAIAHAMITAWVSGTF